MPKEVAIALLKGLLRSTGPRAPATIRRLLTRWRGLTGLVSASSLKSTPLGSSTTPITAARKKRDLTQRIGLTRQREK